MIRPATCISMLLAAGSGLYLYQAKHQAEMLDHTIAQVQHDTEAARARIGVLHGEYALLNDPSRLQDLAHAHLPLLSSLMPAQFTTLAELDQRLPPVGSRAVEAPAVEEPIPTSSVIDFPPQHPEVPPPPSDAAVAAVRATPAPTAPVVAVRTIAVAAPVAKTSVAAPSAEPAITAIPVRPHRRVVTASATPAVPRRARAESLVIPASSPTFSGGAPLISPAVAPAPIASALGMARMLTSSPMVTR